MRTRTRTRTEAAMTVPTFDDPWVVRAHACTHAGPAQAEASSSRGQEAWAHIFPTTGLMTAQAFSTLLGLLATGLLGPPYIGPAGT